MAATSRPSACRATTRTCTAPPTPSSPSRAIRSSSSTLPATSSCGSRPTGDHRRHRAAADDGRHDSLAIPTIVDAAGNVYFVRDSFDIGKGSLARFATIVREPIAGGTLEPIGELQRFAPGQNDFKGIMPFPVPRRAGHSAPTDSLRGSPPTPIVSSGAATGTRSAAPRRCRTSPFRSTPPSSRHSATRPRPRCRRCRSQLAQIMSKDTAGRSATMLPGGGMRVTMGGPPPDGAHDGRWRHRHGDPRGRRRWRRCGGVQRRRAGRCPARRRGERRSDDVKPTLPPIGPFPADKPPITAGPHDGRVRRRRAALDCARAARTTITRRTTTWWPKGRGLVAHVDLPDGTRLVAFGPGVVYLAHPDGDQDYLERYPLPKF